MKKKSLLSVSLAFALLFTLFGALNIGLYATDIPDPEIYYSDEKVDGVTAYWYDEMHLYSYDEALAAGVPEGFTGDVLALRSSDGGHVGITLDYSGRCIDVESITFRVWCSANTREFRITDSAGNDWIVRVVPEATEKWIEITLTEKGENIYSGKSFTDLGDAEGFFKPVNMGFRFTDSADTTVYIDYTNFNHKPLDKEPPVIKYDGDTVIRTTAGKELSVDVTAFDEYDGESIQPEYIFSGGALDENGLLVEGEHSCTVRFTDYAGNVSEIELTVIVEAQDVTAPALSWAPDAIFANTGMRPVLDITAQDDKDGEIAPTLTWSEGALDARGRLVAGEHTLTVTAVDKTGNKTEKVIPVKVTNGMPS